MPGLTAKEKARFWDQAVPYFGLDSSFDYEANPKRIKEYLADLDRTDDPLNLVDRSVEDLISVLDANGTLEMEAVQRAAYSLRLVVAKALGDVPRAKQAKKSLDELSPPSSETEQSGALKPFTVLASVANDGELKVFQAQATDHFHAFGVVAEREKENFDLEFLCAMSGRPVAGKDYELPGEGIVCSETILEQSDVFGPHQEDGEDVKLRDRG